MTEAINGDQFSCKQRIDAAAIPTHIQRLIEAGLITYDESNSYGGLCNVALQITTDELLGQNVGCVGPNDLACPRKNTNDITLFV